MTDKLTALHFAGQDMIIDADDLDLALLNALKDCGAPGDASEAVAYVRAVFKITGNEQDCRDMLNGYGAWTDEELADHSANLDRLVWLTGSSLWAGEPAYWSTYS